MAKVATEREKHSICEYETCCRGPCRYPDHPGKGMTDKGATRHDLMSERKREREVGVEVDDPPRLVLEVATRDADRCDRDHNEKSETDDGREHVGVGGDKDPKLAQRTGL